MFRFGGPDDRPVHAGLPKGAAVANQVSRLKNVTVHQPELAHAAGGVSLLRCQAARVSGAGEVVMGNW